MRQLTESELDKLKFLTSKQIEVTLIEPTTTGLEKSIMDATSVVREFMERSNVHSFSNQLQGPEHKKVVNTRLITENNLVITTTSMYRPKTKKGDPRIWISQIKRYSRANDIIAIAYFDDLLWVMNLTSLNLYELYENETPFREFAQRYSSKEDEIAQELLEKIKAIAGRGFIPSPYKGDTAIGKLLEFELGIQINSNKNPDYKGIELKSTRAERQNRKNLFAQVPDWKISRLKSSREILDHYGYERDGIRKLYCTVSAISFNSQNLRLKIVQDSGLLTEYSFHDGDVVSWRGKVLEERLLSKHKETFWVEAISKKENGIEHFKFIKVEHTRDPIVSQLYTLLEQGKITVDHLIKEKGKSANEKGPIFKLDQNSLPLLFPPSELHHL